MLYYHADVFESLCYETIEMVDDPDHDQARVLWALPDGCA